MITSALVWRTHRRKHGALATLAAMFGNQGRHQAVTDSFDLCDQFLGRHAPLGQSESHAPLLLDAVRDWHQRPETERPDSARTFDDLVGLPVSALANFLTAPADALSPGLELQRRIVRLTDPNIDPASLIESIAQLIEGCDSYWNHSSSFRSITGSAGPGANRSPTPSVGLPQVVRSWEQTRPNWYKDFRSAAVLDAKPFSKSNNTPQPDFSSPAWDFVAETLAFVFGDTVPDCVPPRLGQVARTWVALVSDQAPQNAGKGSPPSVSDGELGELVVEAIPKGSGRLYLHPFCGLSVQTSRDFQDALLAAWRSLLLTHPGAANFDFRWSVTLTVPHQNQRVPVPIRLRGDSAGAAVYCAMRAALTGERLDPLSLLTAAINEPAGELFRAADEILLREVGGLADKAVGLRRERSPAEWHFVKTVIVCHAQRVDGAVVPPEGLPLNINDWHVRLEPVASLEQAYQALTEYGRKALAVKRALAKRATELLKGLCDPCRYIPPRLSRRPSDEEAHKLRKRHKRNPESSQREREELRVPLVETERNAVLMARSLPLQSTKWFRGLILADSGFGKSSLLLEAERAIAADETDLRIPMRLGAGPRSLVRDLESDNVDSFPPASEFDWSAFDALLSQLVLHLNPQLPDNAQLTVEDLRRIIARGDACFLIDAIDQTEQDFRLNTFLAEIKDCAVLTTGRPEIRDNREHVVVSTPWCELKLEPFGERDVVEYCPGGFGAALWKKEEWRDLITVPLLLKQLRDIGPVRLGLEPGAEQSWRINREWVYAETLDRLIVGNLRKLRDQSPDRAVWKGQSSSTISKILAESAWAMRSVVEDDELPVAERTRFAGRLRGESLKTFLDNCGKEQAVLLGTNLITKSFVEQEVRGTTRKVGSLSFRHLSFWEWFCGQHLARLAAEKTTPDWADFSSGNPEPGVVEAFFRDHALKGDRPWVLRFAVSAAARWADEATAEGRTNDATRWQSALRRMARWLLAYGNPFLLTDAVETDGVVLDETLDRLRNWLVFQNRFAEDWYGKTARQTTVPPQPELDEVVVELLNRMFALDAKTHIPLYRDGRWLPGAWELVEAGVAEGNTICVQVRDRFLGEFETRVGVYRTLDTAAKKQAWLKANRGLLQLVPEECREAFGLPLTGTGKVTAVTEGEVEEVRRWTPKVVVNGAGVRHSLTYWSAHA